MESRRDRQRYSHGVVPYASSKLIDAGTLSCRFSAFVRRAVDGSSSKPHSSSLRDCSKVYVNSVTLSLSVDICGDRHLRKKERKRESKLSILQLKLPFAATIAAVTAPLQP